MGDHVNHNTRAQWRKLAVTDDEWYDFEEAVREIIETNEITLKSIINYIVRNVHFLSESDEWNTPEKIIIRALKVMGDIDLDPCTNDKENPNVPARVHFDKEDDGLSQSWFGSVYMNPPYGQEIYDWVLYLREQYEEGRVDEAIALVPSRTDTEWFRLLREYPRCFIWGRLKFSDNDNSAPFPSMAVYLGKNIDGFVGAFWDIGDVYGLL